MTAGAFRVRIWEWSSAKDDVADPVQPILHAPVATDRLGDLVGPDLVAGQVGDRVDGFGVPLVVS
jgi:hypothetical protein